MISPASNVPSLATAPLFITLLMTSPRPKVSGLTVIPSDALPLLIVIDLTSRLSFNESTRSTEFKLMFYILVKNDFFSSFLSEHMLFVKAKNQMCHYLFVFSRLPELEGPVQFLQGVMCHLKCAYYTVSCNSYEVRYATSRYMYETTNMIICIMRISTLIRLIIFGRWIKRGWFIT